MKTNAAERRQRTRPEAEPADLAACLAGPRGLDLVVEMAHDLRSPLTSILFLADRVALATSKWCLDVQCGRSVRDPI